MRAYSLLVTCGQIISPAPRREWIKHNGSPENHRVFSHYPLIMANIAIENGNFQWENPLCMAIFNSYVSLPECILSTELVRFMHPYENGKEIRQYSSTPRSSNFSLNHINVGETMPETITQSSPSL